ncbi:hypothetical protein [Aurantimonas endophytica]|uniref:Uncharacterized protein n=1 Tax=Aurantimonas endophytica TaxID=1522175 RepID=A0A7W6H9H5_9HYPH|nr:hypothetical protein [Aurantimonas endophytica]MBB4000967.1 hypothetical protein [Aurantimonas endophytica]MCO6403374.1 hypothetical protein [Aurantimonas endophytica]
MALYPVAGSRLFIGGVLSDKSTDFIAADFTAAEPWVEIDGWSTMGSSGDTSALITTALINRGRDVKQKGTKNAGQMQNTFAIIETDPGQIALIAASEANDNYAFRIELSSGGERLFIGLVMSAQESGGDANTIANLAATVEINSNVVKVPA